MRSFIALPLPEDLRSRLSALSFQFPITRRVPAENMHITISFLGDVTQADLENLHYELETIRMPSFQLTPRGVACFGGDTPRALYVDLLESLALQQLHGKVHRAIRNAGIAFERRKFIPHITLGRFHAQDAIFSNLEQAIIENAGFSSKPFSVSRFILYQSQIGRKSRIYYELFDYTLR